MCSGLVKFSDYLKKTSVHWNSNKHDDKHHMDFHFLSITANTVNFNFCSSFFHAICKSSKLFIYF